MASDVLPDAVGTHIELCTLGDAAIYVIDRDGARRRAFGLGRHVALLAYLSAFRNHPKNREELVDLRWTHFAPAKALKALRQTVYEVNMAANVRIIANTTPDAPNGPLTVVHTTESDRNELLAAFAQGDTASVVRLFTGEFLSPFAAPGAVKFEHWAEVERGRPVLSRRLRARSHAAR
ncbi:MAG: hypothetical protein ABI877_02350 [Gemmatimonadaceae bacterium]